MGGIVSYTYIKCHAIETKFKTQSGNGPIHVELSTDYDIVANGWNQQAFSEFI